MAKIFDKTLTPSESVYDGRLLDPREIRVNPELNGRHEEPGIEDLLEDFMNPAIGQLSPILITKDDDNAPLLLAGNRRWRAALKLTLESKGPHDDANGRKGVFKLKCQYFKGTPLECFMTTIKENISRKESLPIDDGYNISRLVNNFGMSHADIAIKIYGRMLADGSPDLKWVEDRQALSELASEAADAVTGGRVKPSAVLALAKLSKTAQRHLLKSTEGKITTAVIKRAAAPAPQSDTPETPAKSPRPGKWDLMAFRKLVESHLSNGVPDHVKKKSCDDILREVLGSILDALDEPPTEQ